MIIRTSQSYAIGHIRSKGSLLELRWSRVRKNYLTIAAENTIVLAMKLLSIFLLIGCLQLHATGNAQTVSIAVKDAALEKVFKEIKRQTGYTFFYADNLLEKAKKVSFSVKNAPLEDVLALCFKDQPLSYEIINQSIIVKLKEAGPKAETTTDLFRQINIKGRVTNEAGEPVIASVVVKGTRQGTTTDENGEFELRGVEEDAILVISGVGIETREIRLEGRTWLTVAARTKISAEEEVIVKAGYYDVKKREATGSISRVDAKVIEKQPVTNPLAALHGRMPGVHIQQTTGVPGGDVKIEIRGRNSLRWDGNEPLYIVDGVPFSTEKVSSHYTGGQLLNYGGVSPLTSINSADIESIEVLKDADATAIYGSRGANGVVLITTRKGKAGKTKTEINYYTGFGRVHYQKLLNTEQYLNMRRQAFAIEGLTPSADPNDDGTVNSNYRAYAPDLIVWDTNRYTDWQKVILGNTARTTSVQTSVSGGNEHTQFLMSAGYYRETSVFAGDSRFRKLSSHLSLNHRSADKRFLVTVSVSTSNDQHDQPRNDPSLASVFLAPNAPKIYHEDGSLNWAEHPATGQVTWQNPLAKLEAVYESAFSNIISRTTIGYKILPGLQIQSGIGFNRLLGEEISIHPNTSLGPDLGMEWSTVNSSNGRTNSWIAEPQLSWEREIGKGKLIFLAGGTYQQQDHKRVATMYFNFPSNSFLRDLSAAADQSTAEYGPSVYKYAALFARINYNWDGKYLLNLTGRRDGSSRFGPGKQYANFGAAGASWIFSEEGFIQKKLPWLSFGKLRGSYGITGSDQIGNYQYLDTYETPDNGNNAYNGVTALVPGRLYNPAFGWESNQKLEAALDLGFLHDRISISAAWYRNRSSDQLVSYTLPAITGFNGILSNLPATVQNTGVETELTTVNMERKHFSWTSSINITFPRNKLIAFPNIDSSSYAHQYIVGEPIYIQKFYEYTGVDPQTGLTTVRDVNGDGQISNPADNTMALFIGQDYFGGLNNRFVYKNWSAEVFLQFVKQTGRLTSFIPGVINMNIPTYLLETNRWEKPGDEAEVQRFTTEYSMGGFISTILGSPFNRYLESDASVVDASFIRLKTVSIAYQLSPGTVKGISGNIFLRGQNLLVLTKYKGNDPETRTTSSLPPLRTLTLGLNLIL